MNWLAGFFGDAGHWSGPDGIPARLLEHLEFSAAAFFVAALIAVPLGMLIGHTGRGALLVVVAANAARALPTLGLLVLVVLLAGVGTVLPVLIPLVVLAIPPILVNTYEGVRGVDADLRDAAYGMGLRGRQVLFQTLIPVALPLILLGLRLAAIQVVSTATIAAFVGLGGLGRFIIDGLATKTYADVIGGAVLVAALALAVQFVFVLLDRVAVSPGVRRVR
ncbi:MAG: ABC transporter permease subunit [Microbispora sp.]|nr:ABC transporter permease subunit [Microbispora sp.]